MGVADGPTRRVLLGAVPGAAVAAAFTAIRPARAAKQYGAGVTDAEIKVGNTGPYSGPILTGAVG